MLSPISQAAAAGELSPGDPVASRAVSDGVDSTSVQAMPALHVLRSNGSRGGPVSPE